MKYNLSDFFPVSQKDLDEFEQDVKHPKEFPPANGFLRLMDAKRAGETLNEYRNGRKEPTSIGSLIDNLCNAYGKDKSNLHNDPDINNSDWLAILSNKKRPDTVPAIIYAKIAKTFNIPFQAISEAVIGSFRLTDLGTANSGGVFARSHYAADKKLVYSQDLKNAMEELLVKGTAKRQATPDIIINDFLEEIKRCMT